MAKVRAALIQAYANMPKDEAIKKHEELIGQQRLLERIEIESDPEYGELFRVAEK